MKYRTKTIKSGDLLELEIYPIIETKGGKRRMGLNTTSVAQAKINRINQEKKLIRKIYCNFNKGDIFLTLTFKQKIDEAAARKSIVNYLRRLRRLYKRENKELKYIYVMEYGKSNYHFHLIINEFDRAALIKNWKEGFADIKSLKEDFEGLAKYLLKESNGGRAWNCSKNLKEPKITTNDSKFSRRRAEKMRDKLELFTLVEKLYKNYTYIDSFVKDNAFIDGVYCYIKLFRDKT